MNVNITANKIYANSKVSNYHGCQNSDLDLTILRFYDSTYSKRSGSFKDLSDRSESVESYDSNDLKQP